jgi:hypothetical protein
MDAEIDKVQWCAPFFVDYDLFVTQTNPFPWRSLFTE